MGGCRRHFISSKSFLRQLYESLALLLKLLTCIAVLSEHIAVRTFSAEVCNLCNWIVTTRAVFSSTQAGALGNPAYRARKEYLKWSLELLNLSFLFSMFSIGLIFQVWKLQRRSNNFRTWALRMQRSIVSIVRTDLNDEISEVFLRLSDHISHTEFCTSLLIWILYF